MSNMRLDAYIVSSGLASGRERSKEYIQNGSVTVNGKVITKPSFAVTDADNIALIGETLKYVGRGGLKMEGAINAFHLELNDLVCVDLGASTGGFTDCMLQNGAKKVYAIDVGHDQLAEKLVNDDRVINLEGINVKEVGLKIVSDKIDFVCADLSFISCKYAIDAADKLLESNKRAVILIKPQFEAGKANIAKGGIVKDKKAHINVLKDICEYATESKFGILGLVPSSIKGGDGNIEYLIYLVKRDSFTPCTIDFKAIVEKAFLK